jgi:ABC-type transporter Mla subunit MlaD
MSRLSELDDAVKKLDDLWLVCKDPDQKNKIADQRDALDEQAGDLADLTLKDGTPELSAAIASLNDLTATAIKAKEEIDDVAKTIKNVADTITKATAAAVKVAALIATL